MALSNYQVQQRDSNIRKAMRNGSIGDTARIGNNLLKREEMDHYNKFNRVGVLDPYTVLGGHREYIFFTRPNLQLLSSESQLKDHFKNEPFFIDSFSRYKRVFYQLQSSMTNKPYINLISTRVSSGLDLPTISAGEVDNPSNIYGDTINYRWSSGSSDNDFEFSLEFTDTKYIEVYMLFKIWDEYARHKQKGHVVIPDHFVLNKILHDQVSVFKFIVDEDLGTIIHYSKITGVYPKSVPRDVFSSLNDDGAIKFNVEFKGAFVEDMNPEIIDDFNEIFSKYKSIGSSKDIPIYDRVNGIVDTRWVNIPYVSTADKGFGPGYKYKLKWR